MPLPAPYYSRDGITIYCADCLAILPELPSGSVDAVVTDPPFSSGGAYRGDRTNAALTKYVRTETQHKYTDFTGDNRDQRAFLAWCSLWLTASLYASRPGATLCAFSDWRQLPVITDAIQCGGWTWRNIGTWWKPGCRMQRGRFSASAEYVVYGSNGAHEPTTEGSPQNVFSCASMQTDDKDHIAQKPVEVLEWLMSLTIQGGIILDPFLGSGTTAVACIKTGRRCIGIEISDEYCAIAARRCEEAFASQALFRQEQPA